MLLRCSHCNSSNFLKFKLFSGGPATRLICGYINRSRLWFDQVPVSGWKFVVTTGVLMQHCVSLCLSSFLFCVRSLDTLIDKHDGNKTWNRNETSGETHFRASSMSDPPPFIFSPVDWVGALLFASVVYMASGIWHSELKGVAVLSSFLRKIKEAVVTS